MVRGALLLDEGHEIAEREVHVAEMQTPRRAERVGDSWSSVACAAEVVDLQPGCAAALVTLARVQLRERDPRGGERRRRVVVLTEGAGEPLRGEERLEGPGTAGARRGGHAQHLQRARALTGHEGADALADAAEQPVGGRGGVAAGGGARAPSLVGR